MMNFDKSSLIRRDMDRDNVRAVNTYVQEPIRASEIYDADIVNNAVYGGCLCSYEDIGILSRLEQNQRSLYSSSLFLMITAEVPGSVASTRNRVATETGIAIAKAVNPTAYP